MRHSATHFKITNLCNQLINKSGIIPLSLKENSTPIIHNKIFFNRKTEKKRKKIKNNEEEMKKEKKLNMIATGKF